MNNFPGIIFFLADSGETERKMRQLREGQKEAHLSLPRALPLLKKETEASSDYIIR
jgi:hypothetical protein